MKFPQTGKIEHTFGEHVFGGWGAVVKCENAPYRRFLCGTPGLIGPHAANPYRRTFQGTPRFPIVKRQDAYRVEPQGTRSMIYYSTFLYKIIKIYKNIPLLLYKEGVLLYKKP